MRWQVKTGEKQKLPSKNRISTSSAQCAHWAPSPPGEGLRKRSPSSRCGSLTVSGFLLSLIYSARTGRAPHSKSTAGCGPKRAAQPPLPPQPVYQFAGLSVIHCFSLLLPSFKSTRVDCEKICVLIKALFCRNTLCIARKSDEIRAQIFRKTPQAIYSAFTL